MSALTHRRRPRSRLATAAALLVGASPSLANEVIRDAVWVTNGEVRAIEVANNVAYVGGQFTAVGPAIGSAAVFDLGSAAAHSPYPQVNGPVHAIALDASGGYYIGGEFTAVQGQSRQGLAQIDASGQVTAWNPVVNGLVRSIVVRGSTVYFGGTFDAASGLQRANLAAVDAATGSPLSWAPVPNGDVYSLAASATRLYVGGSFSTMNEITVNGSAAFWLANGEMSGYRVYASSGIQVIAVYGSTVYLAGAFSSINSEYRGHIAAVDTAGALLPWNPGFPSGGQIHTIAVTEQTSAPFERTVWVGGDFTLSGANPRSNLEALDGSTGALTSWNPAANGAVHSLHVRTSRLTGAPVVIYVGGEFTAVGGANRNFLAEIDPAGVATPWFPEPGDVVRSLVYGIDGIHAGGDFYSAAMTPRQNIVAFDVTTGSLTPWNPSSDGPVNVLRFHGNRLFVGGAFSNIGAAQRSGIADLDLVTGMASSWGPVLTCPNESCPTPLVNAISMPTSGGVIYLGGEFGAVQGSVRGNVAAVDIGSADVLPFDVNTNGPVRAIEVHERQTFPFEVSVYLGGDFTTIHGGLYGYGPGGLARYGLAGVDGAIGESMDWDPTNANWTRVNAIRLTGGSLFDPLTVWIGGKFPSVGPVQNPTPRNNAAAIDGSTALPGPWSPEPNDEVASLLIAGTKAYLGGKFTAVGGAPRNQIAAVDLGSGAPTPWDPNAAGQASVNTIAVHGGTVYAGGTYTGISNTVHRYLAAVSDGTVTAVLDAPSVSAPPRMAAAPNPFEEGTTVRFTLPRAEVADVAVFDIAGRRVRRLHHGVLGAGQHRIGWDGRNDDGRVAASGAYFLRVRTGTLNLSSKALRLR